MNDHESRSRRCRRRTRYEASGENLRAVLTVALQALLETIGLGEELVGLASPRDAALGLAF